MSLNYEGSAAPGSAAVLRDPLHRGTSLIRNCFLLEPHRGTSLIRNCFLLGPPGACWAKSRFAAPAAAAPRDPLCREEWLLFSGLCEIYWGCDK